MYYSQLGKSGSISQVIERNRNRAKMDKLIQNKEGQNFDLRIPGNFTPARICAFVGILWLVGIIGFIAYKSEERIK